MDKFVSPEEKRSYMKGLKPFISSRDPKMRGTKIFHMDFPKPDYVIFDGLEESGMSKSFKLLRHDGKILKTANVSGWFLWKPLHVISELNDSDLLNQIIEGCHVLKFENNQSNYYQMVSEIGSMVLDLIKTSHRKEELFTEKQEL